MHEGATGLLVAALLVIPTCLGLWRNDDQPPGDDAMLERLQERRIAHRRRKDAKSGGPVNYIFLETIAPAAQGLPDGPSDNFDRRLRQGSAGRRAEDLAPGQRLMEGTPRKQSSLDDTLLAGPDRSA